MDDWFNAADEWVLLIVTIVLLVGAAEGGAILARRHRARRAGEADRFVSTLAAPAIGLLALMIGFTFAMALTRYELRVSDVVDAANAIEKAELRGLMLPEPHRSVVLPLLKQYATLRVAHRGAQIASPEMVAANRQSLEVLDQLWHEGMAAAASNPQVVPSGMFLEAINDLFDLNAKRLAAGRNRVPTPIFLGLIGIAIVALGYSGYGAHGADNYRRAAMWIMAGVIGAVIILIVDLDRPQRGLITVSQQPLLDLIARTK